MNVNRRAKIAWQCRRGMLELDLLLGSFFQNHFDQLKECEIIALEHFLAQDDPDLYAWLMGDDVPKEKDLAHLVKLIKHGYTA